MHSHGRHARIAHGHRQAGFVLVVVLVAVVVLTLLATAVAVVSERAVTEAQVDADAFAGEVADIGSRDTVLYVLNTHRQTYGGITIDDQIIWSSGQATALPSEDGSGQSPLPIGNEIRLDGTPYVGVGSSRFALQDDAGLLSVNWMSPMFRARFFQQLGAAPGDSGGLEAARLDFQDSDQLIRLGGAEASDYRRRQMSPPPDRPLVTPLQARQIMGWDKLLAGLGDSALTSLLTTARVTVPNVNTAPTKVLESIPGVDANVAGRMLALRDRSPFTLPWQLIRAFELPLTEDDPMRLFSQGSGTLKLWHNGGGPVHMVHWTLTPYDEGGRPWRLDYEITLPRDEVTDIALARETQTPFFSQPAATGR